MIRLGTAFGDGWKLTKSNFFVTLGIILLFALLSVVLELMVDIPYVGGVVEVISMLVSIWFAMGMVLMTVKVVDGDEPYWGVFKEVLPRGLHFFLLTILLSIITIVSALVIFFVALQVQGVSNFESQVEYLEYLIEYHATEVDLILDAVSDVVSVILLPALLASLPIIYISMRLYFAQYLVIDRNMGAMEAIRTSWKATANMQGKMFLFYILTNLINLLGVMCLFVGVFVTMIVVIYAQAALYRQVFPAGIQDPLLVNDASVVVD